MINELKLAAEPRTNQGSAAVRRMRRNGLMPAVLYGEGQTAEMIQLKERELSTILRHHASTNVLMDLEVAGGQTRKVLLQDVQQHPLNGNILHADFRIISMTKKLRIAIPIKLVGEPVGISQQGGILEHVLHQLEVECLPEDIVEHFTLDVTALNIGDHLTVKNLSLDPKKYHVLAGTDLAVAAVSAPRAEEEVAPAAGAEGAEAGLAEPEVLREKKETEEEEGEGEEKGKKGAEDKKKPGAEDKKKPAADDKKKPAADEKKKPAGDEKKKG